MSAPTPSIREQGVQALREGNLDKAIDLLARAVMADDSDAEAKALLGIVYSQKGIHAQAARALRTAVELQPQNPNYRYNLGVVLERSGDTAGAAAAYRDTLALNKDHAQARAKLQAIPNAHQLLANAPPSAVGGTALPPSPAPSSPGGAPPGYGAPPPGVHGAPAPGMPSGGAPGMPGAPPAYGAPPPGPQGGPPPGPSPFGSPPPGMPQMGGPQMGGPQMGGPQMGGPPQPMHGGPPSLGGGLNTPQGPPGTVQCPRCNQFSRIGMTCEWCSSPLAPPVRSASADPVTAAGYGHGTAFTGGVGYAAPPEDGFSPVQAARDWWHALTSPSSFFQEQQGREGLAAPISYLLTYVVIVFLLVMIPVSVITFMTMGSALGGGGNSAARGAGLVIGMLVGMTCGSVLYWLLLVVSMFIWAGIVHLFCKMFGGVAGYSGTFRACSYALAPLPIIGLVSALAGLFTAGPSLRPTPGGFPGGAPAIRSAQGQIVLAQNFPSQNFPGRPGSPGFPGGPGFPGRPGARPNSPFPGLTPGSSPFAAQSPISTGISLIGMIYYFVLLGMGVSHIHSLSTGKSVGVAILSGIASIVLIVLFALAVGVALVGALAGAMGGMGR